MKPVRVAVAAMRSVAGDVEGNLGRALLKSELSTFSLL